MNIDITSEINRLQSVILHQPGEEQNFVMPENLNEWIPGKNKLLHNPDYLLFDDIINSKSALLEHNELTKVLKHFIGESNCLSIINLLHDILGNIEIREQFINECISLEKTLYGSIFSNKNINKIMTADTKSLIFTILTGRFFDSSNIFFSHPIPNLIFTRDIAAVIGKTLVLTWGCRMARRRENIIAKYIFNFHKFFKNINIYDFHYHNPKLSLEGGDIIIFDKNNVCIGLSERTTKETINTLLPIIFNEGFKKVYAIDLPKQRSVMHLDTIFNRINLDEVVIFPPIFDPNNSNFIPTKIYSISPNQTLGNCHVYKDSLVNILKKEGTDLSTINCGGEEKHNQIREQWTEGANFFTIKPGIIVGYDFNYHTITSLEKSGYTHVKSIDFFNNISLYQKIKKILISIPGSELSRGRGGARCLTLPLMRKF